MTDYWSQGEIGFYEAQLDGYRSNAAAVRNHLAQLDADDAASLQNWERLRDEHEALEPNAEGEKPPSPVGPEPPVFERPDLPELPAAPAPPLPFDGRVVEDVETIDTLYGEAIVLPGSTVLTRDGVSFAVGDVDLAYGYSTEPPPAASSQVDDV